MSPAHTISQPYTVLVVDDQPLIAEAVRRILAEDPSADVQSCTRAAEALARAVALRPAVILQDLAMPDGDGLELVERYAWQAELAETAVIVLSATQDPVTKAEAFSRGAEDYIEKLPPRQEFLARVQHHAAAARALRERNAATRALERKEAELSARNAMLDRANARLKELNAELVVDLGEQRQRVEALSAVGAELANIQDLDLVLVTILEEAAVFSDAASGALFVREGPMLRCVALRSNGRSRIAARTLAPVTIGAETAVGEVAASGDTIALDEAQCELVGRARPRLAPDGMLPAAPRSALLLPVVRGEEALGVLALCDGGHEGGFGAEDARLLRNFAGLAAVAIERAQAARNLIFRMIAMAELRDPTETAGHVQRVAGISELVYDAWSARRSIAPVDRARQRDLLRIAAMLHDVGKVGIPDAILKKKGKLDDAERAEMERHAEIGAGLFSGVRSDLDMAAADVALCHHEKWDGSGYPRRLSGDAIPLFARIVAVADVFDALASRRAYKEPWPRERILQLFESEAGRHFDPELAAILVERMPEAEEIRDLHPEH
ncbi:MAG: response regulator [Planctomycetaceae bacterium]|nr:response regulator [Planctomycetaceae bacterium]